MFVGVYPPEKTHRPRKKMVFRGVAADIYIYIVGLVVSWFQMFSMFHHIDLGDPNKLILVFSGDGPIAAQAEPLNACGVSEPQSRCPIGDPWGIPKSCGWKLPGFRLDEGGTPPWYQESSKHDWLIGSYGRYWRCGRALHL